MSLLAQALIFLAAAAVSVPLSKRLGLGSVLGYLAAGIVIGPSVSGLIADHHSVLHFSELGVVLFLFLVGLELQPSRLWQMRKAVFGVGALQVVLTTLVLGAIGKALGLPWMAALVAGFGLSLSSTAFALQFLAEKNQLMHAYGRAAFGILLFQDLAVIPFLAVLPLLAGGEAAAANLSAHWGMGALKVACVLAAVALGGRYVLRPVFKFVASTRSQEVFTATALTVVIGTALLAEAVGLSMSLGAFLAGVMLADSEYRHELEADIEPFKGLLLGLFFIAVGMSVQIGLIGQMPLVVLGLVVGLSVVKALCLYAVGRYALKQHEGALSLAVVISQGGEFAFVLFGLATRDHLLTPEVSDLLILVVGLSMGLTPLVSLAFERWVRPRLHPREQRDFDVGPSEVAPVIIAGFGRVGQVAGRVLRAKKIPFTAMDISSEHIDFIKKFGNEVFYGDAARLDLLRAAKAEKAKVIVVAVDDMEASIRIVESVKEHFPHLTIFARARNRQHAYRLMDLGIQHIVRETFASSLEMTRDVLEALGQSHAEARRTTDRFREHDEQLLERNFRFREDTAKLQQLAAGARAELEQLFERDEAGSERLEVATEK